MIILLLVLAYLIYQTKKGFQIGFAQRIINLVFSAIIFSIAVIFQNPLGDWLFMEFSNKTLNLNSTNNSSDLILYHFIGFFIILFIGKIIKRFIKKRLPKREHSKHHLIGLLDSILGACISFFAAYFFVYIILSMFEFFENPWFIQQTIDAPFLRFIIYSTPLISNGMFKSIFGISQTLS